MFKAGAMFVCLLTTPAAAACDLALALTVDVSASISPAEYNLQMSGLADALLDPQVAEALIHAETSVMLVQWSGRGRQVVSIPWRNIGTVADLAGLSHNVRQTPRAWSIYSTAIGDALSFTAAQFSAVPHCRRRVIDVSGDGVSNQGALPQDIRDVLVSAGFTINGLAIESNVRGLTRYFERDVVGGANAFVVTANNYDDYPRAIRIKLLQEVIKPAF